MTGMRELAKGFEHASVDPKWYAFWESTGAFRADPTSAQKYNLAALRGLIPA